jgi:uncharacterized protein (DUF4415 family)
MNRTIRYQFDLGNAQVPTAAQKAKIKSREVQPEGEMDDSDILSPDEAEGEDAGRNPLYKPTKTSTTVRIDSDVLQWLRTQGKGYQSRINAILRREMLVSLKSARK